jgi:hypothetical protein
MPFGIEAFSQFSLPEVHLRNTPDFLSLPATKLHFIDASHGSTFQVRYVLRGSLFSARLTLADLLSLLPLRGCCARSRSGSGLTANRINLPYASELYPAFNISSRFSSTSALL